MLQLLVNAAALQLYKVNLERVSSTDVPHPASQMVFPAYTVPPSLLLAGIWLVGHLLHPPSPSSANSRRSLTSCLVRLKPTPLWFHCLFGQQSNVRLCPLTNPLRYCTVVVLNAIRPQSKPSASSILHFLRKTIRHSRQPCALWRLKNVAVCVPYVWSHLFQSRRTAHLLCMAWSNTLSPRRHLEVLSKVPLCSIICARYTAKMIAAILRRQILLVHFDWRDTSPEDNK